MGGWNAPNRLVIGRDVRPGQRIQLAVFGINGPLSNPPTNFIWMRYARLRFQPRPRRPARGDAAGSQRRSPAQGPGHRGHRRRQSQAVQAGRGLRVHRRARLGSRRTTRCSSAIRTATRSTATRRTARSRSSARRAATAARISPTTSSPARTASRSTPRAADDQRARQPSGLPPGAGRPADRPRRPVRGQAAQQPERSRLSLRRRAVLHRSAVRPAEGLRRPAQGAAVQRRLLARDGTAAAAHDGAHRAQWHRLLARRALPLRRQLGRAAQGRHALRGRRAMARCERARSSST